MKIVELSSVVGHLVTDNNMFIGFYDGTEIEGDNPKMFARIYRYQKDEWRFTVYENDSEYAVQDYDPTESGFVPMNKERAIKMATEILETRIVRIESGEVSSGAGVGYVPV